MENKDFETIYSQMLMAHIKEGCTPEEAVAITNNEIKNYDKVTQEIAIERKQAALARKEKRQLSANQRKYADILSARIKAGEKPSDVVEDMKNFEM
jgi:hypothetical protein